MSRERNLVKNTGILTLGQLSSKLFTFLLLPMYTSLLLPEDYGTIDVIQTVVSLILYVSTLQIENAVFRFVIENRDDKAEQHGYISSGLVVLLSMTAVCSILIIATSFFITIPHLPLLLLSLWAQAVFFYLSNIARGFGNNLDYSIASFIVTISSLVTNIVFIIGLKMGAASILLAVVISNAVGSIYFICRLKIWDYVSPVYFNKNKLCSMVNYSLPLIPNAISWWITNTSDRLLIITFLGASYNGIYAAANKIPTIYTNIFSAFNTAWTESVSLAMKDTDRDAYINSMLNASFKLFSFLNLGIIVCISIAFQWIIGDNYAEAYTHIYILLIAIFINSMCSLLGGILGGLKNTKVIGSTTVLGAIVNFLINFFMIKVIGLYAASLSTLISYITIYFSRMKAVKKSVDIHFSMRYSLQLIIMLGLVTFGYFQRVLLLNISILFILTVWGIIQNRAVFFPIAQGFFQMLQTTIKK